MILGIGNDITDITRIEKALKRHGKRFEQRCFTATEQQKARAAQDLEQRAQTYAKRFAAKEACAKALGTGFIEDIYLKDIGVTNDDKGRPTLTLNGGALAQLKTITPEGMSAMLHLSLSDEPPHAQAFVIIEARPV